MPPAGVTPYVNGRADQDSSVEQTEAIPFVAQNVSAPQATFPTANASGGSSSMNYSVFVPGSPSHFCFGVETLTSPAAGPTCLECDAPRAE